MTARHRRPVVSRRDNRLRIIGGRWRGRKLSFPDVQGLRPTPDRVRETLFNWLSPVVAGARCLDLFCGSGALGLEALSRGAGHATLVDRSAKVIKQLQHNLSLLQCDAAALIQIDTIAWLDDPSRRADAPYDIIFLDPPFRQQLLDRCCQQLAAQAMIKPGGLAYLEAEAETKPTPPTSWELFRQTRAGDVCCYLYQAG